MQQQALITAAELEIIESVALTFVQAGVFQDTKSVAQAMTKILAGRELGLGPFVSMRDISIIGGKIAMAAAQIGARIRHSGAYDFEILRLDNEGCEIRFYKQGKALMPTSKFDRGDAMAAGLFGRSGDMYKKYPRNMYYSRALTNGARWHCPEVFGGAIYTPDELQRDHTGREAVILPSMTALEVPQHQESRAPDAVPEGAVDLLAGSALENPWLHVLEGDTAQKGKRLAEVPPTWFARALRPKNAALLSDADRVNILAALDHPELKPGGMTVGSATNKDTEASPAPSDKAELAKDETDTSAAA